MTDLPDATLPDTTLGDATLDELRLARGPVGGRDRQRPQRVAVEVDNPLRDVKLRAAACKCGHRCLAAAGAWAEAWR